ncbi:hypothetical protein COJ96_10890 [Bacillus sp. AFS073361]|uniref:phage major capsid protein n=1 Tax=Bacillus sp. AFS073361 TaxID=2033511 RepID=UPI000BF913DE|nr:hypothetical protein [Bacillus sp. AFS073361]PFP29402.1 hypothetical protein COJ96_10890 [Bacillus sp. AFS073361]
MPKALKVLNRKKQQIELDMGAKMRGFMTEKFGQEANNKNSSTAFKRYLVENDVGIREIVKALGFNRVGEINVRQLLDNDGTAPLFNAIVEDGLRMGFERQSNWQQLVTLTISSDQFNQQWYYLDDTDLEDETELRDIGQGAPIPVGTIRLGDNSIKMHKRGRGIEWTDEAKRANIDMISLWLQRLGRNLGRSYEDVAVTRLLNGYFPDGSDAPPTLGVTTAGTLSLTDMFYASAYMEDEYGFTPNVAIMNLATATAWAETRENGFLLFQNNLLNGTFPNVINATPFISRQVPNNRIILVDTNSALVRYQGKAFGVESERNVKTQVEGSYGTEISEFVPFETNARLVITTDVAR